MKAFRDQINRRTRILAAVVAVAGVVATLPYLSALAAASDDYKASMHYGCYFDGYSWYNTSPPSGQPYAHSSTANPGCASWQRLTAWFWNGSSWVYGGHGWQQNTHTQIANYWAGPTTLVEGYHAIQRPAGVYSLTLYTNP